MTPTFNNRLSSIFLRFAISTGILIFLFLRIDFKNFFHIIKTANLKILLFVFFLNLSVYFLAFLRWMITVKNLKIEIPWRILLESFCGGVFFNLFLPSTIGGDIVRIADLSLRFHKAKEVTASVFLDRLSGYLGLEIMLIFALILVYKLIFDRLIFFIALGFSALLFALLFVLFNNFLYTKLNRFLQRFNNRFFSNLAQIHNYIYYFKYQKIAAFNSILISLFIQVIGVWGGFFTMLSFDKLINIGYFFILVPLIGAITVLPISIGGLGVREATIVYFFSRLNLSPDICLAVSLLGFAFNILISGLGGIYYALTLHFRRIQSH